MAETAKSVWYKILYFPLTKIVIGIFICFSIIYFTQTGVGKLFSLFSANKDLKDIVVGVIVSAIVLFTYIVLYKFYEKRKITELAINGVGKNLMAGVLLGAGLQSLTILVMYLGGDYSVVTVNSFLFILPPIAINITVAIIEEILMRGIIFRIVEEKLGSYIALAVSAIIFGALHLANPNSSLTAGLKIAIEAGILLAAAYMYSRSLWFVIAIHFGWNFTQSGIFGANTSGHTMDRSLFTAKIHGADWLTGGQFGPEGSLQATLFCLIAGIVLLVLCKKHNKIIKPFWAKPLHT